MQKTTSLEVKGEDSDKGSKEIKKEVRAGQEWGKKYVK